MWIEMHIKQVHDSFSTEPIAEGVKQYNNMEWDTALKRLGWKIEQQKWSSNLCDFVWLSLQVLKCRGLLWKCNEEDEINNKSTQELTGAP